MISNNTIYGAVNFKHVYCKANEILTVTRSIDAFPFKVRPLINEMSDISLCSYKKALNKYNISIDVFGSESAVIMEYRGMLIIFYDQDEPSYRIRFSIVHEYGHYVLGHEFNLKKEDPKYAIQEIEANCFAAQLLMPEQILRECRGRGKVLSTDYIVDSFGVSREAAEKRQKTMATTIYEWKSRAEKEYDDIILFKYITGTMRR